MATKSTKKAKMVKNKVLKTLLSFSVIGGFGLIPLTSCNNNPATPEEEPEININVEGVDYDRENSHIKLNEESYIIFKCVANEADKEVKSVQEVLINDIPIQSWDFIFEEQKLVIPKKCMVSLKIEIHLTIGDKVVYKTAYLNYDTAHQIDTSGSPVTAKSDSSYARFTFKSTATNAFVTDVNLKVNNTLVGSVEKSVITKAGVEVTVNLNWDLIAHGDTINVTFADHALFATEASTEGKAHIKMTDEGKKIPEKVIIPSSFGGATIDGVCDNGFEGSQATELEFADASLITSIGSSAFASSKITTFTIPSNITAIPNLAFSKCSALATVVLHDQIVSIGQQAFEDTIISSMELPTTLMSIGKFAFKGCQRLLTVKFKQSITDWHQSDDTNFVDVTNTSNNATYLTRCSSTDENNWGFTGILQTGIKKLNISYDSSTFEGYDFVINTDSSSSFIYNAYNNNIINVYVNAAENKNPCPVTGKLVVKKGEDILLYQDISLKANTKYEISIAPSVWTSLVSLENLTVSFEKDVNEKWVSVNLDSSVTDKNIVNTGYSSLTSSFSKYASMLAISNPSTNPSYYANFFIENSDGEEISATTSDYVKSTASQVTVNSIDWSSVEDLSSITLACTTKTANIKYSTDLFTKYGATINKDSTTKTITSCSSNKVTVVFDPESVCDFKGQFNVYKSDGTLLGSTEVAFDGSMYTQTQTVTIDIFDNWNSITDNEELTLALKEDGTKKAYIHKLVVEEPEKDGLTWTIKTPEIGQNDVIEIEASYDTSESNDLPSEICLYFYALLNKKYSVGHTANVYLKDGETKTFTINVDMWKRLSYTEENNVYIAWSRADDPDAIYNNDFWQWEDDGEGGGCYCFINRQYGIYNAHTYTFVVHLDGTHSVNTFEINYQWLTEEHEYETGLLEMELVGVNINDRDTGWVLHHEEYSGGDLYWLGGDAVNEAGDLIITVKVKHNYESPDSILWWPLLYYDEPEE